MLWFCFFLDIHTGANYVPHLLFHVQIVVFRNSFFRHLNKALIIYKIYLIHRNFGFIVCYDIDNVHIEVKNVLEYIIALVVVKNKVRLKKCLKKLPIWQSSIVQINLSITPFKINTKISTSFRRSMLISFWIDMTSICTLSMSGKWCEAKCLMCNDFS
jgi:hypothetical protein